MAQAYPHPNPPPEGEGTIGGPPVRAEEQGLCRRPDGNRGHRMAVGQPVQFPVQYRSDGHIPGRYGGGVVVRAEVGVHQRRLDRDTGAGRATGHRAVQHRGFLSRPELLLEAAGRAAAVLGADGNGLGPGGQSRSAALGHRGRGGYDALRFPALRLRAYGHGRAAAAGGQHTGVAAGMGRGEIHRHGRTGNRRLRGGGLPVLAAAAAGPARDSGVAAGVGDSLGRPLP